MGWGIRGSLLDATTAIVLCAAQNERRALEDRARAHRRLLAELSLLLSVEGVGVQSDFASPVVSEMVVRQCRDVTARARAAGRQAGEAGQQATRELEARLEAAISQQTRAAREAEQRIDEWRRKCEGLQVTGGGRGRLREGTLEGPHASPGSPRACAARTARPAPLLPRSAACPSWRRTWQLPRRAPRRRRRRSCGGGWRRRRGARGRWRRGSGEGGCRGRGV